MKTLVRIGLLFVLLGMLQYVVGLVTNQSTGLMRDAKRVLS